VSSKVLLTRLFAHQTYFAIGVARAQEVELRKRRRVDKADSAREAVKVLTNKSIATVNASVKCVATRATFALLNPNVRRFRETLPLERNKDQWIPETRDEVRIQSAFVELSSDFG
jgi:hypothetical protein